MRLVTAELLKVWTAPRTLLGILLSEMAIVLIGTIATLHSAVNDPVLPPNLNHGPQRQREVDEREHRRDDQQRDDRDVPPEAEARQRLRHGVVDAEVDRDQE